MSALSVFEVVAVPLPRLRRHSLRLHCPSAEADLAASPTSALPGSDEKVRVMCERARLGQELWHPDDARYCNDLS